jgi:hypothetical protein
VLAWPVGLGASFALQALHVGPLDASTLTYLAAGELGECLGPLLAGTGRRGAAFATEPSSPSTTPPHPERSAPTWGAARRHQD